MLRPIRKVKILKNRFSVNSQNLLYTIFCESTVVVNDVKTGANYLKSLVKTLLCVHTKLEMIAHCIRELYHGVGSGTIICGDYFFLK